MAEAQTERGPWWTVVLDEPTDTLFATTDDNADTNLRAVLYSDREPARTVPTDTQGVACVRTETPICALYVAEGFMRTLMATLRANGCTGHYRKAGTDRWYEF